MDTEKKRIAVIGLKGLPAFGGAATVGENIIDQLKHKYEFTVYSTSSHTNNSGIFNGYHQIVFKEFPVKKLNIFIYYIRSAIHALFKENFHIIHLHHSDGAFILPWLRLKYPVLSTSHAKPQLAEKWSLPVRMFFVINEWIMLKTASEISAVSNILASDYQKRSKHFINYIPNGINVNQSVDEDNLQVSDYILFAAGRIIPLKGLHILLRALKKIRHFGNVLIIGDISQVPKYKAQILKESQGLTVTFKDIIKKKSELLNYVKKAKLFVFPSYSENMSIMLLEAAFVNTPIICSDIPANKAIFSNEEVLFFSSSDSSDLGAKMIWALQNPEKMQVLSKNAYSKLLREYDWRKIALLYEQLYLKMI